jgi:4-amino-4-deoxy-L-arabinose transferase-like glycosyltransferase
MNFIKKNKYIILLYLVLLLASFLRLYRLAEIPPGFIPDEADMGYSAYSILKTGLSQYGTFNPLAIQEFSGGSHPPVYTYILMPLIKMFGLSIFVDRLPSAIFGIGSVLILYLIVRNLFKKNSVALLAAFLMSVNPWSIQISRQGLLESVSLFFVLAGILFFLQAKSLRYYIFSAILFGISLFSYDAPKIFLPIFIPVLILFKKKELFLFKKSLFVFLIIFGLFYSLILKGIIFDGNIRDYSAVSAFNKTEVENIVNRERTLTNAPLWLSSIFHNKLTVIFDRFAYNYASILNINWLYLNGAGNFHQSVGTYGEFHIFNLPLLFIGLYLIFKKNSRVGLLLLAWFLMGIVPGGITSGNNPLRSSLMLPIPIICSAYGLVWVYGYLNRFSLLLRKVLKIFMLIVLAFFIVSYLVIYFMDYPVYASDWWRKQENLMLNFVEVNKNKYEQIFVDGRFENRYAFFNTIEPRLVQNSYKKQLNYRGVRVIKIGNVNFGTFGSYVGNAATPATYFPNDSLIIMNGNVFKNEKSVKDFYDIEGNLLYRVMVVNKQ